MPFTPTKLTLVNGFHSTVSAVSKVSSSIAENVTRKTPLKLNGLTTVTTKVPETVENGVVTVENGCNGVIAHNDEELIKKTDSTKEIISILKETDPIVIIKEKSDVANDTVIKPKVKIIRKKIVSKDATTKHLVNGGDDAIGSELKKVNSVSGEDNALISGDKKLSLDETDGSEIKIKILAKKSDENISKLSSDVLDKKSSETLDVTKINKPLIRKSTRTSVKTVENVSDKIIASEKSSTESLDRRSSRTKEISLDQISVNKSEINHDKLNETDHKSSTESSTKLITRRSSRTSSQTNENSTEKVLLSKTERTTGLKSDKLIQLDEILSNLTESSSIKKEKSVTRRSIRTSSVKETTKEKDETVDLKSNIKETVEKSSVTTDLSDKLLFRASRRTDVMENCPEKVLVSETNEILGLESDKTLISTESSTAKKPAKLLIRKSSKTVVAEENTSDNLLLNKNETNLDLKSVTDEKNSVITDKLTSRRLNMTSDEKVLLNKTDKVPKQETDKLTGIDEKSSISTESSTINKPTKLLIRKSSKTVVAEENICDNQLLSKKDTDLDLKVQADEKISVITDKLTSRRLNKISDENVHLKKTDKVPKQETDQRTGTDEKLSISMESSTINKPAKLLIRKSSKIDTSLTEKSADFNGTITTESTNTKLLAIKSSRSAVLKENTSASNILEINDKLTKLDEQSTDSKPVKLLTRKRIKTAIAENANVLTDEIKSEKVSEDNKNNKLVESSDKENSKSSTEISTAKGIGIVDTDKSTVLDEQLSTSVTKTDKLLSRKLTKSAIDENVADNVILDEKSSVADSKTDNIVTRKSKSIVDEQLNVDTNIGIKSSMSTAKSEINKSDMLDEKLSKELTSKLEKTALSVNSATASNKPEKSSRKSTDSDLVAKTRLLLNSSSSKPRKHRSSEFGNEEHDGTLKNVKAYLYNERHSAKNDLPTLTINKAVISKEDLNGEVPISKPPMHPLPSKKLPNSSALHPSKIASTSSYKPLASSPKIKPIEVSLKLPLSRTSSTDTLSGFDYSSRESSIIMSRSPSPAGSVSSRTSVSTYNSRANRSRTSTVSPRRTYPQSYSDDASINMHDYNSLEQAPVVFEGNLSFLLSSNKQRVHQTCRPKAAHRDPETASNYLSTKIDSFLRRTDHVMDEWKTVGRHKDDDTKSLVEMQRELSEKNIAAHSRSVTNIMIKSLQIEQNLPPTERKGGRHRSFTPSMESDTTTDDRTIVDGDFDELSEMTVDLAEEHSASNITSERLDAETAERLKLEKELQEQQNKVRSLQETSEKLEMELICAKSDLNGISEDEDGEHEDNGGIYKMKYERVARELEFTKRRLQTQHEHDLEQLVGLKKQLEKKLNDAYEEVEEQRQVVGQWKRKTQKMTNEMNDLRMLLEEQNSRNNLLEKRQRKFDSECQNFQDLIRQERQAKERLGREKDVLIAEKFTLEQNLADTRLELELKEEKLASMQREMEEMTFGGGTEEEIGQLRRQKMEMERRVKEQEEELDEMAGQVQVLEQAKLRLEMSLETMRKDARREAQQRDEELEEARGSAYKKVKSLECQLETEHEERTLLVREKHELERRLSALEEQDRVDRATEEIAMQKLKRDLRKYKALLRDAQAQLDRLKADSPGKALIRQLRNQLEDAEATRSIAMKARQTVEAELADVQQMYEETQKARNDADDRAIAAVRDRTELQAQIEENDEEMSELMKKYSAAVKQLNTEHIAASEYELKLSELESEKNSLKEQIAELQARLENAEHMSDPSMNMHSKRLELRARELESRLELEQATKARIEVQCSRLKDALEKAQSEMAIVKAKEHQAQETNKKSQKNVRELRDEFHVIANREQESITRRKDLEKKVEGAEAEIASLRNDLRLALQRIADLQQAMEEGDTDPTESENETDSSDESFSELEQRLKPITTSRHSGKSIKENGVSKVLFREGEKETSPRIMVTSSSASSIAGNGKNGHASLNGDASYA